MEISPKVTVTPSRVELGHRCYRRHAIADQLKRVRYFSPSLEFGSIIHAGAAAWWSSESSDGNIARQEAKDAVRMEWGKRFESGTGAVPGDLTLDTAIGMIDYYTKNAELSGAFSLEPGEWQLVAAEERLEIPLGKGMVLSFQNDRIVWNKQMGHLVVVDTKTASRVDYRWKRQWETTDQMKLYKKGVSVAFDIDPEKVDIVIEGLVKKVPSALEYVVCPPWEIGLLDEAWRQAVSIAERDRALMFDHDMPRDVGKVEYDALVLTDHNYQCCFEYGVECPYRRLCLADPDERVSLLHGEYFTIEGEY